MENIIHLFVLLPFLGFLISVIIPEKKEAFLSRVAFFTVGINLLFVLIFTVIWLLNGHPSLNLKDFSLYHESDYDFYIDFYVDKISLVFLLVGTFLSFLVTVYSKYYMHRESGYKRFFNTILFFYMGFNLVVLSGNFETLFIGWEILGISSFLLIAFYRGRYLPVKNALKVFTIYRIGDVGILLAMWISHHLWHENITFLKLNNYALVEEHLLSHSYMGLFFSLMILIAAAAKSAQLPFSAWLPRAMEGPTPSSAIFYGSLSVHIGAFLLLRTFPFWEHQESVRWIVGGLGFCTALITSTIAKVQSTIKSQVAYSSAAQIGIIFIEIALGWETLALFHFAGNAFLRTYQLLISPSVVTYKIREQFYQFSPAEKALKPKESKFKKTLFLWALKEFYLDSFLFTIFFNPLKKLGRVLRFLTLKNLMYFFTPLYVFGFYLAYGEHGLSHDLKYYLSISFAFLAFIMVAKAYNERNSARLAWVLIIMGHFFVDLAITFNDHFNGKEVMVYISGVVISGIIGFVCLQKIKNIHQKSVGLNQFHGFVHQNRTTAFVFLFSCLGLAGFPITTTFFGEDLILTHIHENQFLLAFLVALIFVVNGIAVVRIYARVFLGNQTRTIYKTSDLTA